MTLEAYLLLMLALGGVTYIPRWLPLQMLASRRLPEWLTDWLDLIPVALLSALLAPALLTSGRERVFDLGRIELWVALPTLLFALRTRSLGGTVMVGMGFFWLARTWLG